MKISFLFIASKAMSRLKCYERGTKKNGKVSTKKLVEVDERDRSEEMKN